MGFKKKHFWSIMICSALISPFVFFSSSMKPWERTGALNFFWHELIYPIEYGWHSALNSISSSWSTYIFLQHAATENEALKKELFMLKTRVMDYEHQLGESARLRKILGFSQIYKKVVKAAEVIGTFSDAPFQSLRVAKGEKHGIQVGMPVVASQGVVGRILRTGSMFSDIQLLGDVNFNLDVMVERTRIRGVLYGVSNSQCRLKLHKRADIRIGDTIVTSGITGSFPKGLPLGRVVRISYEAENVSQIITIQLWVDYHGLEEVAILIQSDQNIETIKEVAGKQWLDQSVGKISGPNS